MNCYLPKSVEIDGLNHEIRNDFRVILEIIEMLNDAELNNADKAEALLDMFYVYPEKIVDKRKALEQCFDFINQGHKSGSGPKLVEWSQDFDYIIAPVNRVIGHDIRGDDYDSETNTGGVHWWTFLSAYMEIGHDCLFSQIVNIRDKLARHKKMEKYEREWYQRNRQLVDIKRTYTDAEEEMIKLWTGGG